MPSSARVFCLELRALIGVPIGIGAGIYLAEFGRGTKLANAIRFTADVLNGVPSIVMGLAAYSLIVIPQKHFSALSGGVALGIMMIPTVARTSEEMLLMVPNIIREAALGLGLSELAVRSFDHSENRFAGHHYRLHAGVCARGRRNSSADFHGAWQCLLEHESESADRGSAAADLGVCNRSL